MPWADKRRHFGEWWVLPRSRVQGRGGSPGEEVGQVKRISQLKGRASSQLFSVGMSLKALGTLPAE
jgi:hypothetical protein